MFRAYDMVRLKHLFRGSTPKPLSPITDEDLEAYKYAFTKPGKYLHVLMPSISIGHDPIENRSANIPQFVS